jgi:hypothetical protein
MLLIAYYLGGDGKFILMTRTGQGEYFVADGRDSTALSMNRRLLTLLLLKRR